MLVKLGFSRDQETPQCRPTRSRTESRHESIYYLYEGRACASSRSRVTRKATRQCSSQFKVPQPAHLVLSGFVLTVLAWRK